MDIGRILDLLQHVIPSHEANTNVRNDRANSNLSCGYALLAWPANLPGGD